MSSERDAFLSHHDVSRETLERLDRYDALLRKWSDRINLVSRATLPQLWSRHIADSAQLLSLAPGHVRHWADLGAGGGFPGIVVAIMSDQTPRIDHMTLVESDQRKATFLRTVVRELGLSVCVETGRVEETAPLEADVLSARALAPLSRLLEFAERHLAAGGVALFPKGASHATERDEALECWRFHCETHPSLTDPQAVIYRVSEIERA